MPMVTYRVHWVILRWPTAPCSCHSSSLGITTPRICMMIEAVMYGMIPRAKMAKLVMAPPENRVRKPSTPLWLASLRSVLSAPVSMPGTGRCAPNRYSTIIRIVNNTLLRRSGTLKMLRRLESTEELLSTTLVAGRGARASGW